jgi:hypothetical protein
MRAQCWRLRNTANRQNLKDVRGAEDFCNAVVFLNDLRIALFSLLVPAKVIQAADSTERC